MGGRLPAHGLEKTRPPRIAPGRPCRLFRLGAGPDHAELAGHVVLVEGGVDRSRKARVVQLDRDVGAVLLRHLLPGCADLDIAGEDPEVRAAVVGRIERDELRLGVELQRLDGAGEVPVFAFVKVPMLAIVILLWFSLRPRPSQPRWRSTAGGDLARSRRPGTPVEDEEGAILF